MTEAAPLTPLRLTSFALLAYLPHYIAKGLRVFETEGLDVSLMSHTGPWSDLISAVEQGTSDIVVGNMWFALLEWGHPNMLLPIAPCVQQCGSVMVTKKSDPNHPFEWQDLEGRTIAVQSDVPTPWIALRESLALHELDLDSVRIVVGLDTRDAVNAVGAGAVDYAVLHIDRVPSTDLEEVAALADVLGPIPWSVYFAERSRVEADPEPYRRFQEAIGKALSWMASSQLSSREMLTLAQPWAPNVGPDYGTTVIDRYRALDAWPARPGINVEDVERWQAILVRWGLMPRPVALNEILAFAQALTAKPDGHT